MEKNGPDTLFLKEKMMRNLFVLFVVALLTACGGSSEKPKVDLTAADSRTIQAFFDQVVDVEQNLKAAQKEIQAISVSAKKARTQEQKEKVAADLMKQLARVGTETKRLDDVKIPEIHDDTAKKHVTDAIALQKGWANNQRAKYVAAMQGDSRVITRIQEEADAQAIKIVLLYTQAAQAVGYEIKTDKKKN